MKPFQLTQFIISAIFTSTIIELIDNLYTGNSLWANFFGSKFLLRSVFLFIVIAINYFYLAKKAK